MRWFGDQHLHRHEGSDGADNAAESPDVTGFLPAYLGLPGILAAGSMTVAVVAAPCGVPLWFLPLAAVLAIGPLR
jgi:hypothetical protein